MSQRHTHGLIHDTHGSISRSCLTHSLEIHDHTWCVRVKHPSGCFFFSAMVRIVAQTANSLLAWYTSGRAFHFRSCYALYIAVFLKALENIVRFWDVYVAQAFAHNQHIIPALHRTLQQNWWLVSSWYAVAQHALELDLNLNDKAKLGSWVVWWSSRSHIMFFPLQINLCQ